VSELDSQLSLMLHASTESSTSEASLPSLLFSRLLVISFAFVLGRCWAFPEDKLEFVLEAIKRVPGLNTEV